MAGQASRENGKKGGRPKQKATLEKEAAREYVRQRITAELGPLIDAQLKHAKGLAYLVARRKEGGKFERIEATRVAALTSDDYVVEVWEKDPSVQAFTDLLNRAIDKPKEQVQQLALALEADPHLLAVLDAFKAKNRQS